MGVNQRGEEVFTDLLFPDYCFNTVNDDELRQAVSLLCEHLQVRIVRTNATKRGATEIKLDNE